MKNPVEIHTLFNGLKVLFVPCEASSAVFGIFVKNGSRHEKKSESGISHFIEHMLFKGTPTRKPVDISRAIEGRGGNFNAFTSEELTCYYAHVPDEHLFEAVDILSDMYLNASIDAAEFEKEKRVIIEELRMYADEPDAVASENLQSSLFPRNPLGRPVGGTVDTVSAMTPEMLRSYIKRRYSPLNTVVAVAGSFDANKTLEAIGAAFSGFRCAFRPVSPRKVDVSDRPLPECSVEKDVKQLQLAIGYRICGRDDPARYAAVVTDAILGRGMSSRLFQEVREKRALAYDISSHAQFFEDTGMFAVTMGLAPENREKAISTVNRELEKIKQKNVSVAELRRVKEFLIGNFKLSHENVKAKMFFHATAVLLFGKIVHPSEQIDGIAAVTAADVRNAASRFFVPENRSVSSVVCKNVRGE